MDQEPLLDIKEVATYLNLTESTIYAWVNEGMLPAFRVGRRWRFRRSEVEEWLEAQRNVERDAPSGVKRG